MARGEKLMVSFSVAHDYVPDGLVVKNPDYIVPFPPDCGWHKFSPLKASQPRILRSYTSRFLLDLEASSLSEADLNTSGTYGRRTRTPGSFHLRRSASVERHSLEDAN